MDVVGILLPFVLLGIGVLFVGFSGGPAAAREAYLTRGGRAFRIVIPIIYVVGGLVVPAVVIANRHASAGTTDELKSVELTAQEEKGKRLFRHRCASCHNLDAVDARGVTGPDLDQIGQVSQKRVLNAIRIGGTGAKRMPAGIYGGSDAQAVAAYVSRVAGK
jgi:cytochrome c553